MCIMHNAWYNKKKDDPNKKHQKCLEKDTHSLTHQNFFYVHGDILYRVFWCNYWQCNASCIWRGKLDETDLHIVLFLGYFFFSFLSIDHHGSLINISFCYI